MASTTNTSVGAWLGPERRPLTVLLGTGFLSLISNQLTSLAVPWFVLVLTGSATKMGITAAATMLPSVVMMFLGGAIADRTNERRLSAFADVLSGVTVALVPLLFALDYLTFEWLLVLMVAGAIFDTPGYSARAKLLPKLAERGGIEIERVTSLQGIFQAVSMIFGAILAGVLIASLGATNVLWINAAAFAISAMTMMTLIPEMHVPREEVPSVVEDIKIGFRYVSGHAMLRPLVLSALVINGLLTPFAAVLLPYLANTEWQSATRYGLLISGFGAGALIGSIAAGMLTEKMSRSTIFRLSLALLSLPVFVFVTIPNLPIAWIAAVSFGIGSGLINPLIMALFYRITHPDLIGRANGLISAGAMIASPLGVLLIAPFLENYGLGWSFLVIGLTMTLFSAWIMFASPLLREIDKVETSLANGDGEGPPLVDPVETNLTP